jgi:hypothetical protein
VDTRMQSATSGNRILTPRDLAQHLGSTESWWIRQRPRMVKTGLLVKAGRRFIGDLAKIQAAIADPAFWADESEVAQEAGGMRSK